MDDDATGIGVGGRRGVKGRFQRRGRAFVGVAVGPGKSRRRHLAGAQLARDALPGVCVATDTRHVEAIEHEAGGFQSLVVAGDAVAIENRPDFRRCNFGLGQPRRIRASVRITERRY